MIGRVAVRTLKTPTLDDVLEEYRVKWLEFQEAKKRFFAIDARMRDLKPESKLDRMATAWYESNPEWTSARDKYTASVDVIEKLYHHLTRDYMYAWPPPPITPAGEYATDPRKGRIFDVG